MLNGAEALDVPYSVFASVVPTDDYVARFYIAAVLASIYLEHFEEFEQIEQRTAHAWEQRGFLEVTTQATHPLGGLVAFIASAVNL